MKNTHKSVTFSAIGSAGVLEIDDIQTATPSRGEVLIKVDAFALNRADVMFRTGTYLEQPIFPSKIGYEASGIVESVGPDVQSVKSGDRVSTVPSFSMGEYGVYGEKALVPEHAVAKYPDNLSPLEGTSIWMTYITAYGALIDLAEIKSDDFVLVTAASSGVGLATIELAKTLNATVIAVTRTREKVDFLKANGADFVISLEHDNLPDMVKKITNGRGADVIFDPVAGELLAQLAEAAAQGATIIEYGALAQEATTYPLFEALSKGLRIQGYTLFEITRDSQKLEAAKSFISKALKENQLKPKIDRVFTLDEVVEAHVYMESNVQKGKILISLNS